MFSINLWSIFIYSNANSIANINRQLIEASISNCQVSIGNTINELELENYSLVINSTDKVLSTKIPVYKTEYILSEKDIADVREILENISIGYNLKSIFPKEYSYTYHVKEQESWHEILENICQRLVNERAISQEEAKKIIEREESGNPLIINKFSVPHCISKRENFVICVYIYLDHPVMIEGNPVTHILLTVMNPAMNKSINIFKFLYRYLQAHEEQLAQIQTYDEFISFI